VFPYRFYQNKIKDTYDIFSIRTSDSPIDYSRNRRYNSPFRDKPRNPITGIEGPTHIHTERNKSKPPLYPNPPSHHTSKDEVKRLGLRNSLDNSDIERSTTSIRRRRSTPRDPLDISDIEGATTTTPKRIYKARNSLYIADIEGTSPKKPKEERKSYNTLDYSDVQNAYKRNPSINLPKTVKYTKEVVKDKGEVKGYTSIAKNEMKIIRAIGPKAAKILREAKYTKSHNKKLDNSIKRTKTKCSTERVPSVTESKGSKEDINCLYVWIKIS